MTKQEYINKVIELRCEFKKKLKELDTQFIKEETSGVEIGDLVSCGVNIIVEKIEPFKDEEDYSFNWITLPLPKFIGLQTKGDNGVPSKLSPKSYVIPTQSYEVRKRHDNGLCYHNDYKWKYVERD